MSKFMNSFFTVTKIPHYSWGLRILLLAEVNDFVENIILEWEIRIKIKKIKPKKD